MLDAAGNEITRHGPSRFLGEVNLLSGQAAFVTAVAATPVRYIAVEREALRSLLFEDGPLSSIVLATFIARREALQQVAGLGVEIVGPHSSAATRRLLEFVRSNRLPVHVARPGARGRPGRGRSRGRPRPVRPAARALAGRSRDARAVAGVSCRGRSASDASSRPARRSTCSSSEPARPASARRCTAPPRASRRWSSRAARWVDRPVNRAGSRTTWAFRPGSPGRS